MLGHVTGADLIRCSQTLRRHEKDDIAYHSSPSSESSYCVFVCVCVFVYVVCVCVRRVCMLCVYVYLLLRAIRVAE